MSLPQPQMRQKSSEIHAVIAEIEARRVRAVRIGLQIIALVLIVVALLLPLLARAATSADVEREIAGAFERSEFTAREQWALAGMVLADIAGRLGRTIGRSVER